MQAECRQKAELPKTPCYSIPQLSAQKKRIVDSLQEILPPRARTAGRERQLRRTTRKVMKGAENAVLQLDRMVGDFVEKHMDS